MVEGYDLSEYPMPNEGDVPGQKPRRLGLIFFGLVLFIVFLWSLTPIMFWLGQKFPVFDVGPRGTFGDSFGAINSLFTGLALAGVAITAFLQQRDIEKQREELAIQRFETSFFSMLSVFNDVVNSIDLYSNKHQYTKGRDCMRVFRKRLVKRIKKYSAKQCTELHSDSCKNLTSLYDEWWEEYRTELSHYFRTLFHIVTFVDEAPIDEEAKKKYVKIVRALLSDQEQVLLFYNCLGTAGKGFMKNTVRYELVKHAPSSLLAEANHKDIYYSDMKFEEQSSS